MMEALPDWLKTTVPGIIVLGTCGSLLALLILYLLKRLIRAISHLFRKVLPEQAERIAAVYKRLRIKVMYS